MEKEKRKHSSILIPYSYYSSRIPDYFPFVPLHWHREWELNVITEGKGAVRLGERETEVKTGDIVLIQQCFPSFYEFFSLNILRIWCSLKYNDFHIHLPVV